MTWQEIAAARRFFWLHCSMLRANEPQELIESTRFNFCLKTSKFYIEFEDLS